MKLRTARRLTAAGLGLLLLLGLCAGCRGETEESVVQESESIGQPEESRKEESQEESRKEESQAQPVITVPDGWTEPDITYARIPEDTPEEDQVRLAMYVLGRRYGEKWLRVDKQSQKEKYGYEIDGISELKLTDIVDTTSYFYRKMDKLYNEYVAAAENTWMAAYTARARYKGKIDRHTYNYGENYTSTDWNLGCSQWVVRKDGTVYAMMSASEYTYGILKYGPETDPFALKEVNPEEIPVTTAEYTARGLTTVDFEGNVRFNEEWNVLLKENARIYSYEAASADSSESAVTEAALALGKQWLDACCAGEYAPGLDESYKIREYKDLKVASLYRSAEASGEYNSCGPMKASDSVWVVEFGALLQGDGDYSIVLAAEWKDKWIEYREFFYAYRFVLVQDGRSFKMVLRHEMVYSKPILEVYRAAGGSEVKIR